MSDFCLPPTPKSARANLKVDKNQGKCVIFVYRTLQIRGRGPESRQKTGEMRNFCLPLTPSSIRAVPEVEQNLQKSEKCSTADSKSGPRDPESRTKSRKIGKMFYR